MKRIAVLFLSLVVVASADWPCATNCPPGGIPEGEPLCEDGYVDNYNGGCNSTPYVFQDILCGQVICGTSGNFDFHGDTYRDTDWYRLELSEQTEITWEVIASFPSRIFIIDAGSENCNDYAILDTAVADTCETNSLTADLPAGVYWLWIGPEAYTGVPCGAPYIARLICDGDPPPALDAPEQLDPVDITPSGMVARWLPVPEAETYYIEVGLDTNFNHYLPGYAFLDVAQVTQYQIDGLTEGGWYAIRITAWNASGFSEPSRTVWVPASSNTPYEEHPLLGGPMSEGAISEYDPANMFHGAGMIYDVVSSAPGVVAASITQDGFLQLDPLSPGVATITVTATDPVTGYATSYSFDVIVVGEPLIEGNNFKPREPWNPRFEHVLELVNDSGEDAVGVRVLFLDLADGITVENQTGISWDGRPMIEMDVPFGYWDTLELTIVYVCEGVFKVNEHPPTIEVQYILPAWQPLLPGAGVVVHFKAMLPDGRIVLEFDSVPGVLYGVEYMNNFPAGDWISVPVRLRAGANRTQWIDSGPPATAPAEGVRVYRVKPISEGTVE